MFTYLEDKNKQYDAIIKKHLKAYNEKFTGKQVYQEKYLYALNNHSELIGALVIYYFWDWMSIGKVFYNDLNVLKDLVFTSKGLIKEAIGIKLFTPVKERYSDFLSVGFIDNGQVPMTDTLTYYHAYFKELDHDPVHKIIICEAPINDYQKAFEKHTRAFNEKHGIKGALGQYDLVCLDNDQFVGGVQCLEYQDTFYIDRLVVKDNYRDLSIGKTLMIKAENHAKRRGYDIIELGSCDFQAKDFYEKLGYNNVHARKNHPRNFTSYTLVKYI